jgi:hypothetical protein
MKTITRLVFLAALLILSNATHAQNLIAVQNGGTPKFYASLDSAITHTSAGDTLYLPGGSYSFSTQISKCLHFVGVGYNPDSSAVTLSTQINSTNNLDNRASGGSMTGIDFTGTIYFGSSSAPENYTFCRCKIYQIISWVQYGWSTVVKNNKFYENIIGYMTSGGESNYFINNIFGGLGQIGSSIFKNNIFFNPSGYGYSSTFENNIFISQTTFANDIRNSTFRNNLFLENISFPYLTTNLGTGNIVNQTQASIFVNQTGNAFDYTHNYHLKSTCPGKNAGTDGTDIGIYGGSYPWKEGAIPNNPHFQSVKIAPKTDANGSLNVNIQVKAQDN